MTTFSQMVDSIVQEVRRKDLLMDAARYLNQTIREVHADPITNNATLFRDNLQEIQLSASVETGFTWEIPSVERFQGIALVQYAGIWVDGEQPYVKEMKPGRALAGQIRYYYRGGSRIAFAGYGGQAKPINIAWFEFPRNLKYKAVADRKVTWDDETGFTFDPSLTTPELQEAAMEFETNWLLRRWEHTLSEGLRAKIYKRISDDARSRTAYSLYAQHRTELITAESYIEGWQ